MSFRTVLLSVFLLFGCAAERSPFEPFIPDGTGEEYRIYRTLVADTGFNRAQTVVFNDSTQALDFSNGDAPWKGRMPGLSDETLENFQLVNRTRVPLKNISCPGKSCILISGDDMAGWNRMYPEAGGVVTVSRVGFDRAGSQAFVYWSVFWAPLASSVSVVLLD
jgi:hypothetical protein